MRILTIILMLIVLTSCKTEFRKTIEKFPNGKASIEYVYPDKEDSTKFTFVAYYENGDTILNLK